MDIDELENDIPKNNIDATKEAELKISKKTRNLLKVCKLAFNKPTYDAVILHLIDYYKKHKLQNQK